MSLSSSGRSHRTVRPDRAGRLSVAAWMIVLALALPPGCGRSSNEVGSKSPAKAVNPFAGVVPPPQPPSGPGGRDVPHPMPPFISGKGGVGGYTIYEPNPRPASAPVIVVLHGNCFRPKVCNVDDVTDTIGFNAALTHFAMEGSVVIFPRYQRATSSPSPTQQTQVAINSIKAALSDLQTSGGTRVELDHVGIVGHSRGAYLAANVAVLAPTQGLPRLNYLLSLEPGLESHNNIPSEDYRKIPGETNLLVTTGDRDMENGEGSKNYGAGKLWDGTTQIPDARRDYVRIRSDTHGRPSLMATHSFPSDRPLDALDYFVFWKLADALVACTRTMDLCEYALGDTPQQRFMGTWSDGVPVKELCVTDNRHESWQASCANSAP